jgi:Na+/glutamate symporter
MIDPNDPLVGMATFGRIVEDFINGPIGTYLVQRAKSEEEDALEKLKTVDADHTSLVRKYQNEALIAGKVIEWLADAIHQGQMALERLKEEEDGN